ncbi:MAG: hypothetical protein ACO1SX_10185 [Actinomycetota bacterium]
MIDSASMIREQVRLALSEVLADAQLPLPAVNVAAASSPFAVASGSTVNIRVAPSGEVNILVTQSGEPGSTVTPTVLPKDEEPQACCITSCGLDFPTEVIEAPYFSDEEEGMIQNLQQALGCTREQVLGEVLHSVFAGALRTKAAMYGVA